MCRWIVASSSERKINCPDMVWAGSCDPLLKFLGTFLSLEDIKLDASYLVRRCIMTTTSERVRSEGAWLGLCNPLVTLGPPHNLLNV